MAIYTKEYETQPEAILTNVIVCPAVDLSANVAVPVHCQVENVFVGHRSNQHPDFTGSCGRFGAKTEEQSTNIECRR